jgi:predicted nucleic acid-binding protein
VNGFLLDTNVISELFKPRPDVKVSAWVENYDESLLFLSVLTLGELRKGVDALGNHPKRARLETWLERDVRLRFFGRVLPVDDLVADRWGRISGSAAARGTPMPVIDGLLAATALQHDLTFATRDTQGIAACGVAIFNPWI